MSQADKAQLKELSAEKKRRKNKRWKRLLMLAIDAASHDRVHGEIVLTLYDGEVRQISKTVRMKNADEEIEKIRVRDTDHG